MKTMTALLAATALTLAAAAPAYAEDAPSVGVSFNIGAVTDYVFRGVTQTDEDAAVQGGVDLSYGMFYAGLWASNVKFPTTPGANEEVDLYFGFKPTVGPIALDIGFLTYLYPGADELNIPEFKLAGSYTFPDGPTVGLSYFYSPEYGEGGPATNYVELAGSVPLGSYGPVSFAGVGSVGSYTGDKTWVDYNTWKIGVTGALENGIGLELSYTDSDLDGTASDGRVFFGVKYTFSAN
jgi:uncharacterized protein (TIGR02001 family)